MSVKVQRIMWIKRLYGEEKNWDGNKWFFDYCLQFVGGRFIFYVIMIYKNIKFVLDISP